ncbi:hypothetical protein evm_007796 [Chilo suppressalis]|nr:hypothetical protein evm_007796 [Chilo suppressalis]
MEVLKEDAILEFPKDTLQVIRNTYELDKPGVIDKTIDILELWLKKQDHFVKKDFSREYLERCIIRSKGSVERSKERLDKMCTARTMMPEFFTNENPKDFKLQFLQDVFLPKLTKDYYRVYILKNFSQEFTSEFFTECYKRMIRFVEYLFEHDYCYGVFVVLDLREANIMEFLKKFDVVQLGQFMNIMLKTYSLRVKGIHLVSTSKLITTVVSLLKQVVSEKIASRIGVHKDFNTIYEHVEKHILPEEYGGKEIPMTELHNKWLDMLSSKDFMEHIKNMNEAKTNEALRRTDEFNEQYLGMPGTFRSLSVD